MVRHHCHHPQRYLGGRPTDAAGDGAGYIFQVEDAQAGPLLAIPAQLEDDEARSYGKLWEDGFNVNDGQGIPDSFLGHGRAGPEDNPDEPMLVLGVGICQGKEVLQPVEWEITQSDTALGGAIRFTTHHAFPNFEPITLERTVTLASRTLRSDTRVVNTGADRHALSWYPHPFFPQPDGDELLKFSMDVSVSAPTGSHNQGDGYEIAPSGWLARKGCACEPRPPPQVER